MTERRFDTIEPVLAAAGAALDLKELAEFRRALADLDRMRAEVSEAVAPRNAAGSSSR